MKTNEEILNAAKSFYKRSRNHGSAWREEARDVYDVVAGHQWAQDDITKLNDENRPVVTFNRVGPIIDAVAGSEVINRQEVRYVPRGVEDSPVNELFTDVARWIRESCDAEDEESDAFTDALVCGMGWTETHIEYDEEPDGQIYIDRVDPLEMYWDPAAKKRNLVDCRYLARSRKLTREEFELQWPGMSDEVGASQDWDEDPDTDHEVHDAFQAWEYKNDQGSDFARNKPHFTVLDFQWYEMGKRYRILIGERMLNDVSEEKFRKLKTNLDSRGIEFQYVGQPVRTYYRAFVSGNTVLEKAEIPAFTYIAITGKRDRNKNHWYGLVRPMVDPQRWANKFFSQILHIINSNAKGGILAEEGAFKDPSQAERDYARTDSVVWLNPGGLNKIRPKEMGQYPSGIDRMMDFSINSFFAVTGINLEFLGMANRQQANVTEQSRKQAGLTILSGLFDSLRRYRKQQGRLMLEFIREYLPPERLARIKGDASGEMLAAIEDPSTVEYDVVVDDAPTSPNQKEQVFGVLMQLMPVLQSIGMEPPPELIDYLPLPTSLTEKWKQSLSEPDPMQQQMAEIAIQERMAAMEKDNASAQLNIARIDEVYAKIQEIQAELGLKDEELAIKSEQNLVSAMSAQNRSQNKAE